MPNDGKGTSPIVTEQRLGRRKMMAISSAAIAGGLAGCSGGGGKDGEGTGTTNDSESPNGGGSPKDATIDTWIARLPSRMTWNPWATSYPWTTSWMFCEPLVRKYADGSVETTMLDDWNYDADNQVTTVKFSEDWYWWNGNKITAADKYWFEETARLFDPEGSSVKRLEMPNKFTLKRYHKEKQNPQLLKYNLGGYLGALVRGYREKYKPWAEKLQGVSSQSERQKIQENMGKEMKLPTKKVMNEGLGTGAFKLTNVSSRAMEFEKFDKHPYADKINIPKLKLHTAKDQALSQKIKADKLDFGFGSVKEWAGKGVAPDHVKDVAVFRDSMLRKLAINQMGDAAKHLRKRKVRQALAHVVNANNVTKNMGGKQYTLKTQSGLPPAVAKRWVGDSQLNKYIKYPVGSNTKKAASLMREAGYQKSGGNWQGPGGETVKFEFPVQSHQVAQGKTIKDQLQQFGFKINFISMSANNFSSKYEENRTMDLYLNSHGSLSAHPYFFFRPNHEFGHELGEAGNVKRWLEQGETHSQFNGRPLKPEIPTKVGKQDLSGSTETVNLFDLWQEWGTAQSDKRNKEIARKFSWFWNFHLPQIDLYQPGNASWLDTKNFKAVDQDKRVWKGYRASFVSLKRGKLKAKTK